MGRCTSDGRGGPPAPATAWPPCGGLTLSALLAITTHPTWPYYWRNRLPKQSRLANTACAMPEVEKTYGPRCIGQCVQYCPDSWQATLGSQDFMHAGSLQDLVVAVGGGRGCITILLRTPSGYGRGSKRRIAYTPCCLPLPDYHAMTHTCDKARCRAVCSVCMREVWAVFRFRHIRHPLFPTALHSTHICS